MDIVFMHTIKVASGDIDDMNHVNNVVYLRWVQDAAAAHWDAIASEELKNKYAWVVLRHEIGLIGENLDRAREHRLHHIR